MDSGTSQPISGASPGALRLDPNRVEDLSLTATDQDITLLPFPQASTIGCIRSLRFQTDRFRVSDDLPLEPIPFPLAAVCHDYVSTM